MTIVLTQELKKRLRKLCIYKGSPFEVNFSYFLGEALEFVPDGFLIVDLVSQEQNYQESIKKIKKNKRRTIGTYRELIIYVSYKAIQYAEKLKNKEESIVTKAYEYLRNMEPLCCVSESKTADHFSVCGFSEKVIVPDTYLTPGVVQKCKIFCITA